MKKSYFSTILVISCLLLCPLYNVKGIEQVEFQTHSDAPKQISATTFTATTGLFGTYNPSDDSYTRGGTYSNDNYNADITLLIKRGTQESFFRKTLVKFNLSAIDFSTANINKAVLRMYAKAAGTCAITASKMGDNWTESTVTWANTPEETGTIISTNISSAGIYYEWDITSYCTTELLGDKIISVSLFDFTGSGVSVEFNSKDSGSNLPQLVLYSGTIELPTAPSSLTAKVISNSKVELKWTDNSNNENGFKVERKTGNESFTEVANLASSANSYIDSGLTADITYSYRITAYNVTGNSAYSNEISATPNGGTAMEISVTDQQKQHLRFGIDAERLWYWRTGTFGQTLANLGVKELNAEYVRVAIYAKYEREEGVITTSAYNDILDMMTAMKTANPDIKFFATPRPLDQAYSSAEITSIWGGNCPWAPVPSWVMSWVENGTNTDGTTKWKLGTIYSDKLARYYADYLNFMYSKGFKIDYLDITNEKNDITATHCKYLYDNIPGLLNAGVYMPELVAPSAWNYTQGVSYLNSFTASQRSSYSIAACHNTDKTGTPLSFATAANNYGKEPWDSELHGWVGIDIIDEILNSHYFFEHINAGFVGLDTWLFYGPLEGKDHTMLWSNSSQYIKSSKYEIFKKVVNNANGGNYVVSTLSATNDKLLTTSFIKNNTLMVWVLNSDAFEYSNININFGNWQVLNKNIEVTCYNANYPRSGKINSTSTSTSILNYPFEGESLYCFKIQLDELSSIKNNPAKATFELYPNPAKNIISVYSSAIEVLNSTYQIYDIAGRLCLSGVLKANSIPISNLADGLYNIKLKSNNYIIKSKFLKK